MTLTEAHEIETIEAAQHVLGHYGIAGGLTAGSFTTALIEAISRADGGNFALMRIMYQELADAVYLYKNDDNGIAKLQAQARS